MKSGRIRPDSDLMFDCGSLQEVAAELAAGTLVGQERAEAMAHVAHCQACRDEVADLAGVIDGLLLLAPPAEPPVGFETRVLDAIGGASRPSRRPLSGRMALAAAAVLLVVGLVVGAALALRAPAPSPPLVAVLHARGGQSVGEAVRSPGWVALHVEGLGGTESYRIELDLGGGRLLQPGAIQLVGGRGTAQIRLSGSGRVAAVRLVSPSGDQECEARFT
jgi:anti-sigma-K factor RskA